MPYVVHTRLRHTVEGNPMLYAFIISDLVKAIFAEPKASCLPLLHIIVAVIINNVGYHNDYK